jgi:hypothetical protein
MTRHSTADSQYKGFWERVDDECQLCEMEKRTKWYIETRDWIVAEKLGSGPFVVYKRHTEELSDEEWADMERIVSHVFDEFDVRVLMNIVTDHWHGHILTDCEPNVEPE